MIDTTLVDVNFSLPHRLLIVQAWALNHLRLFHLTHNLISTGIVRHSHVQPE